jgi:hypothetical protein
MFGNNNWRNGALSILLSLYTILSFATLAKAATNSTNTTTPASGPITVSNTILVFAPDTASGYSATSGLLGYGIPYQLIIVPQAGIVLPVLNSSATVGNYGGIVTMSELSYDYGGTIGWTSALTAAQWQQLYNYQLTFGVRMVRIDVYPQSTFGQSCVSNFQGGEN